MADVPTFLAGYPEFQGADPTLVTAKMAEAQRALDPTQWGLLSDDGIYLLTAQKLSRSPWGNSAKLSTTDGRTVYDDDLDRMRQDVSSGYRVT